MKSCDDVLEELTARLADLSGGAGALSPPSPEVAEHLATCETCRREAEELARLWNGLAALETAPPAEELRPRFDALLHAYQAGLEGTAPAAGASDPVRSHGRAPRWLAALLPAAGSPALRLAPVAAVALLVGLGLGALLGARRGADVDSLRAEVHSLNEMVALSLLDQPSAVERLRGVAYGGRLDRPDRPVLAALVKTATADPNVNVRLAALDALAPVASEPPVQEALIRALPHQDSPLVQIALVDLLLDTDGARARRAVTTLADDPAVLPEVRQHVRRRLGTTV